MLLSKLLSSSKNFSSLSLSQVQIKKMTINYLRHFIFKKHFGRIGFSKESNIYNCLQLNQQKKILDPRNAKEHYESFVRKKNTKSVKQSKIITQQLKDLENPNIAYVKSVIIEHPRTSHELSKNRRQTQKVPQIGSIFLNKKESEKGTFKKFARSRFQRFDRASPGSPLGTYEGTFVLAGTHHLPINFYTCKIQRKGIKNECQYLEATVESL